MMHTRAQAQGRPHCTPCLCSLRIRPSAWQVRVGAEPSFVWRPPTMGAERHGLFCQNWKRMEVTGHMQ